MSNFSITSRDISVIPNAKEHLNSHEE